MQKSFPLPPFQVSILGSTLYNINDLVFENNIAQLPLKPDMAEKWIISWQN